MAKKRKLPESAAVGILRDHHKLTTNAHTHMHERNVANFKCEIMLMMTIVVLKWKCSQSFRLYLIASPLIRRQLEYIPNMVSVPRVKVKIV